MLKSLVPAKDGLATQDALAVLLSLPDAKQIGSLATDWAKRQGLDAAGIAAARAESESLSKVRAEASGRRDAERGARATPESGNFPQAAWTAPTTAAFAEASARTIEATRALLARAGGSATLHESDHIAVLAESDDAMFAGEAAALEAVFVEWSERFDAAGVPVAAQARVPVVFVSDKDRWRQLIATAFGGDPEMHADTVTVYAAVGSQQAFPAAIVLVAPEGDRMRARHAATVGLARAILHYTGAPARGPAFLNEGLPRVMADLSTPKAGMDTAMRRQGLSLVRGGGSFVPVVRSAYGDTMWTEDPRQARALSYIFVRWLWDNESGRLLRFAKSSAAWGAPNTPSPEARFAAAFGMSTESACARAKQWFMTND